MSEDGDRGDGVSTAVLSSRRRQPRPSAAPSDPSTVTIAPAVSAAKPSLGSASANPAVVVAALHAEETARMRGWATAVIMLSGTTIGFTPALPGGLERKLPFLVALGMLFVVALWARSRCADEKRYTPFVFRLFGWVAAITSIELVYFLGVFSPVPVVITLGITYIGLGLDRRYALVIPLFAVTEYIVLSGLVIAGVIADRGVIRATDLTLMAKLFGAIMVPVVWLMTLGLARLSRRTLEAAARRSHEALQLANQREAQLAEANQNLEQALRAGAGREGRWTGARAGAWQLAEIIGRGAMGEIYSARHTETTATAAVKLLRESAAANEQLLERFIREGEIAGSLDVPNIVRVHGMGRIDGKVPYMVMELLQGEDLAAILRRRRVLDTGELTTLIEHVAHGLDAAHVAGIIHRDLKPQNLFRAGTDTAGVWKILDFGVSTLASSTGTLTQAAVVGTPGYMAPEQAQSRQVDVRCDVFSFGAVLYRAITGRPPFGGADTPQILFEVVYRMPRRPSDLVTVTADVDAVLAIALAKRAEDRFASAGELAAALIEALGRRNNPALRRRAAALLERQPWGQSVEQ
jgi:tRNA A-37 threonylcarbamoyl transferase component Bud32